MNSEGPAVGRDIAVVFFQITSKTMMAIAVATKIPLTNAATDPPTPQRSTSGPIAIVRMTESVMEASAKARKRCSPSK